MPSTPWLSHVLLVRLKLKLPQLHNHSFIKLEKCTSEQSQDCPQSHTRQRPRHLMSPTPSTKQTHLCNAAVAPPSGRALYNTATAVVFQSSTHQNCLSAVVQYLLLAPQDPESHLQCHYTSKERFITYG